MAYTGRGLLSRDQVKISAEAPQPAQIAGIEQALVDLDQPQDGAELRR